MTATGDRLGALEKALPGLRAAGPAAVVLPGGRAHGLAFSRSLGRRGVPVIALGLQGEPGLRSRFCIPIPIDELDDESVLALLSEIGARLPSEAVLFPTDDSYVALAASSREALERWYRMPVPAAGTTGLLVDKRLQVAETEALGVANPRTRALTTPGDARLAADEIPFPCLVKPAFSQVWKRYTAAHPGTEPTKLARVRSGEELIAAADAFEAAGAGALVQEEIEGPVDHLFAVYAYCPAGGEPARLVVRRKLRDWPHGYGNGSYSVTRMQPDVEALGRQLLDGLGYRGLANAEFKLDARDDRWKLIELNPRGATQFAIAAAAGVDLPWLAYQDMVGRRLGAASPFLEGIFWMDFGVDARAARTAIRNGSLSRREWVRQIRRVEAPAYAARDDPGPGLARATELARAALGGTG